MPILVGNLGGNGESARGLLGIEEPGISGLLIKRTLLERGGDDLIIKLRFEKTWLITLS